MKGCWQIIYTNSEWRDDEALDREAGEMMMATPSVAIVCDVVGSPHIHQSIFTTLSINLNVNPSGSPRHEYIRKGLNKHACV